MKRRLAAVAALLTVFVVCGRPAAGAEAPLSDSRRREITRTLTLLEEKWIRVWATRDVSPLEEILADDFVATIYSGLIRTKGEHIAGYREDLKTTDAVENNEMIVHVFTENAAVVTGLDTTHSRGSDGGEILEQYRWTDTWLRRKGVWQCVATHETRMQ